MKKKLLAFITAAMSLVFALSACNGDETTGGNGTHTHTYSEQWAYNDTDHWHACTGAECDEVKDKAAHTWDNGTIIAEPTCTAKGEKTYTCTVCSATKTEEIATTVHTFSDKWESDDTHHWHKCINCDEISGKAKHSYSTDGVCVCGYKTIPEETLPTTLNELMQEGNEKYRAVVVKTLNDHLLEDMLYNTFSKNYDVNCVEIEQWEVVDSDEDGIIDCIKLHFFYDNAIISMLYRISSVEPKTEITLQDLLTENPDAEKLDEAFDRGTPFANGAKYSNEHAFGYDPTIQEMRKRLLNAVNEKLANDNIISAVGENSRSFINDYGTTEDAELEKARHIKVTNLTENGYEEIAIIIKEAQTDNDDTKLIENLNEGYYKVIGTATSVKFTGALLKADMSENGGTVTTD